MGLYIFIIKKTQQVFAGIDYWIIASLAIGFGYLLLALRGSIPIAISILLGNILFLMAGFLRIIGLKKFFNNPIRNSFLIFSITFLLFYTSVLGFFTYIIDTIYVRTLLIGISLSGLSIYTGILLIKNIPAKSKYVYYFTASTFFSFALIFIYRITGWVFFPSARGLFTSSYINSIQFMSSMVIDISCTTMFFVIHNQRLNFLLKESEEKFRTIFEKNSSAMAIIEADSSIAMVNDEYTKLSGYSNEEVKGSSWTKQITEEDLLRLMEYNKNRLNCSGDAPEKYEFSFYKKNGEKVYALISVALIPGMNKIIASFIDITDRKNTELQLEQMANELKILNANKNLFFSIMAHDLKNPFNNIILLSEMLLQEPALKEEPRIKNNIGTINIVSKQTYYLLEDLLSWVKSQDGKIIIKPKNLDVIKVIDEVVEKARVESFEKNIAIVAPKGEYIAYADLFMLTTILRNLITNAIKYTHKGGRIEILVESNDRLITISIADNGVGIKKENISKLFSIAEKFTTRGTENEKGSGLGLILCAEFVDKLGGTIWVESEVEKGSIFKFTLPLKTVSH